MYMYVSINNAIVLTCTCTLCKLNVISQHIHVHVVNGDTMLCYDIQQKELTYTVQTRNKQCFCQSPGVNFADGANFTQ